MSLHDNCLELGRKMTLKKNNFTRAATGTNNDKSLQIGFFDGFTKRDQAKICESVKKAIYAKELEQYTFKKTGIGSMQQYLQGLIKTELKQTPLVQILYDIVKEHYKEPFTMYICTGVYDIPTEQKKLYIQGHNTEEENCNIYNYIVGAICKENAKNPIAGFLYPAFDDRDSSIDAIDLYSSERTFDIKKICQ